MAGFIGSPAMNLIEAECSRADDGYRLTIGDREVSLGEEEVRAGSRLESYAGRKVVAGIRPESLEDAALTPDAPATRRVHGVATLREALGSDALVHFTVDGSRGLTSHVRDLAHDIEDPAQLDELDREDRQVAFVGRFHPQTAVRAGESVEVAIQEAALTLFDPQTGQRI